MDRLAVAYRIPLPHSIYGILKRKVRGRVLDLGCGEKFILERLGIKPRFMNGIDVYPPYSYKDKRIFTADIRDLRFLPYLYDTILLFDVLEHLNKKDGNTLLDKLDELSDASVIILSPSGFIENHSKDNEHQEHLSGWNEGELKAHGYTVKKIVRFNLCKYWVFPGLKPILSIIAIKEANK